MVLHGKLGSLSLLRLLYVSYVDAEALNQLLILHFLDTYPFRVLLKNNQDSLSEHRHSGGTREPAGKEEERDTGNLKDLAAGKVC